MAPSGVAVFAGWLVVAGGVDGEFAGGDASVEGKSWTIVSQGGQITVRVGRPERPDVELTTDAFTLNEVLHRTVRLDDARTAKTLTVQGDAQILDAVVAAVRP